MKILAIETSCDDTGVAIIQNGKVKVSLVRSQVASHAPYGGVVPEIASREHVASIYGLVDEALREASLTPAKIDLIAATKGPGLSGSLLVGLTAAQTLGAIWDKPVEPVNHLMGHLYAGAASGIPVVFPTLVLLVSGGHTQLILMTAQDKVKILGETRDDAAGEAFDKVARMLGLPYPGGPEIAKLALTAKDQTPFLPRPMIDTKDFDLSFSGLKTAVLRELNNHPKAEIAYDLQAAVADVLLTKLARAAAIYKPKQILLAGGVAANQELRERATRELKGYKVYYPALKFCTDNAAMIGLAAYYLGHKKDRVYTAEIDSSLSL
jgi:N6-L-threonylcarbamoyladenine synthase